MSKVKNSSKGNMLKLVFSVFMLLSATNSFARTFYISNDGNDSNTGLSEIASWQTLARVSSASFQPGDQVLFRRGDSFYGSLTIQSSGSLQSPISFGAFGSGPNPVITGFTTVTNWVNLGNNIWESAGPVSALQSCNMVVVDGKNTAMGRWPNSTNLTYEASDTNVSISDNELAGNINWAGAEAVISKNGFTIDRCLINNHKGSKLEYTSLGTSRSAKPGGSYFIQNDRRTLDINGEWYYNVTNGKLSVYMRDPNLSQIQLSTIDNLVKNETGADYIVIENIDFKGSNGSSLKFDSRADHCSIVNCNFSFSGCDGVDISGNNSIVNRCQILNTNGGGIVCNGANAKVLENSLKNIGLIVGQAKKIVSTIAITINGDNPIVQYNHIDYTSYMGIYFASLAVTGTIKNNFISHTCQIISDAGSIYLGHNHPNTRIIENIIVNSGGNGIYLDEYCDGVSVERNTIYGCAFDGIKLHKSKNNKILNNLSYSNSSSIGFENHIDNENNLYGNLVLANEFIAKTSDQTALRLYNNFKSVGVGILDSNIYLALDNAKLFRTYLAKVFFEINSIEQWRLFSGQDITSKNFKTSKNDQPKIFFEYNNSKFSKTLNIDLPMSDLKGKKYYGQCVIQPYASLLLIEDPASIKLVTEYKYICEGSAYNGWTETGRFEQKFISENNSYVLRTTFLTVNPRYTIAETVEILEGESYRGWSKPGVYTRNLQSMTGCDSIVTTNLVVKSAANKQGQIIPTHFMPSNSNSGENSMMKITIVSANLGLFAPKAGDELAVFCRGNCLASVVLSSAIDENDDATYVTFRIPEAGANQVGFIAGDSICFRVWNAAEQTESIVSFVYYLNDDPSWITNGQFCSDAIAFASLSHTKSVATGTRSIVSSVVMQVYPNPCKGKFNVRFADTPEKQTHIRIFDVGGREIVSRVVGGTTEQFDIEGQKRGVYLVTAVGQNVKVSQKIIVD